MASGAQRAAVFLGSLLLLAPGSLRAQSFCEAVNADTLVNPVVLGNGTPGSVTTAAIQAALNAGGHIRFDVGASPTTIVLTQTLVVTRAVVLDGAGVVTLSGGDARRILELTNPQNLVYTATLQNITLANASTPAGRGAAIFKQGGDIPHRVSLKLVNCTFRDNAAMLVGQDDGGGALYATLLEQVQIANSTFTTNRGSNGGAVYTLGTRRITVVDSTFTGNQATGTDGNPGNGGNAGAFGVDGADRQVNVCRTRFVSNTSNAHGAGFFSVSYDTSSNTRFEDVTFEDNRQLSSVQHTGGAYVQGGPFAFERVSFLRNEARAFGGLFVGPPVSGASGTIRNATFVGNVARTGLGGAIAIDQNAPVSIVNTTIANNSAPGPVAFAGGIAVGPANQLRLTNVILANNTGGNAFNSWNINNPASQDGGGNMQWPQNRPNGGAETRATPSTVFADPLLAATDADNGGAVRTIALTAASPARDTGVTTGEVPATDARGVARFGPTDRGSFEIGPTAVVSIADASVAEGRSGTVGLTFTVTLSAASPQPATVSFATADGTATAPADYVAASGILTFNAGVTSRSVTVTVNGDVQVEPNETFFVRLTSPSGATLGDAEGGGTITDDDPQGLSVSDLTLREGLAPSAVFTVFLSPASSGAVTVAYATANGSALAPPDYTAAAGTLTFAAGETTRTVSVPIVRDQATEGPESFTLNLSNPSGAPLGYAQGTATILDAPSHRTDFDGDLRADILWRNVGPGSATGALFVWLMSGANIKGATYLDPIATDWVIQFTGDFNGDFKSDVLWRNVTAGAPDAARLYFWMMDGPVVIAGTGYPNSDADFTWQVQGVGDLDGDGNSDIVWRNVGPGAATGAMFLWLMDGRNIKAATYLDPISTDWQIQRVGDLNGDGKADILWRNTRGSGADRDYLFVWIMNGAQVAAGTGYPNSQADSTWQVQAIGDLNGDGKQDIVWRNVGPGAATGALFLWLMDGRTITGATYLDPISTDWQIQGTADFNGDGKSDILWRNLSATGPDSARLYVWMMDGPAVIAGTGYTNSQADFTWDVKQPR